MSTLRQFYCIRCRKACEICSRCDRGQIYCGQDCSLASRLSSVKASGNIYQKSFRGRLKHAERQRRYRERIRLENSQSVKKVTHQGSLAVRPRVVLKMPGTNTPIVCGHCHFCGSYVGRWLRGTFLRRRLAVNGVESVNWPMRI